MTKKLHVHFHFGDKFEIDANILASVIASNEGLEKDEEKEARIRHLLEDEFDLLEKVWEVPWQLLNSYAKRIVDNEPIDAKEEWKQGNATLGIS